MSAIIENIDLDIDLKSNFGKVVYFINDNFDKEQIFTFSSNIENVGVRHDCKLKNYSKVLIISDIKIGNHPTVGEIDVIKVFCMKSMWVPYELIKIMENK